MARRIRWSREASDDLTSIHDFIAIRSRVYAKGTVQRIYQRIRSLRQVPFQGHVLEESPEYRDLSAYPYRIIYRVTDETIEIVTIIHGSRDWPGGSPPAPPSAA